MSIIQKPYTFSAGAVIIASEHNQNFDTLYTDYNGNITNANLASNANIVDTKLAQITTANKVNTSAITGTLGVTHGGTGQTSYTNGQLLIGNTTGNTLTKTTLTAGSGISITNGAGSITIASGSGVSGFQVFTTDGTFTVPTGVSTVLLSGIGGGGGGGGGGSGTNAGAGGGGENGHAFLNYPFTVTPAASLSVTIGVGGSGGAGQGGNSPGDPGVDGTDTIIDTFHMAGGKKGGGGTTGGGTQGKAVTAGLAIRHTNKQYVETSPFSAGGESTGLAGSTYGGGGCGGDASGFSGGAGANGILIVTW